jgi:hypothetical protein
MFDSTFLVGGQYDVAKLFPMWGNNPPLRIWAEAGLVHWIDNSNGTYGAMTWRDAAERTIGLSEMITKSHEEGHYCDETRRLQRFVGEMEGVIRKAKEQGGPKEQASRRPKQVYMKPVEVECW